jgi:dolichol-phosphate mannosyltransferase
LDVVARYERFRPTLVVRTANRGLSQSVCEGLARATNEVLVVMDADLSHPPESIPQLVAAIARGSDFAIGSRYVAGGSTSGDWGVLRWMNSRVATLLARPFTAARDPMSGFFALRRDTYLRAAERLNPIGYKIGLELIVKCGCHEIAEVPIHFDNRHFGESKLTLREQLRYLQHLRRLAIYKYGTWSHLAQFLFVGGVGTVVNLAVLTLLLFAGVGVNAALAAAIAVSMVSNFALNRRFTFSYARHDPVLQQFAGFVGACLLGAILNYTLATALLLQFPRLSPQLAALAGIVAGSGLNFLFNRFAVFRQRPLSQAERPRAAAVARTRSSS